MDATGKFFFSCWCLVALVLCTVIVSVCAQSSYRANTLARIVNETKVDPMRAACALDIGERKDGICAILAAK